ncbi:MAG TPA: dihydropteroate synthase [Streptosporangiaceae bacterium]|jgi:dihydropteroate synthase
MGVLNVTPDSFSDGGLWFAAEAAVQHGLDLIAQGADIVDVGGESTRPGAGRVPAAEELRRVGPVVAELAAAGVPVSIDTMRAPVARAALEAGAVMVNDVSGGLADPQLPRLAAEAGVPYVVAHWRGHSSGMTGLASYSDVVSDVRSELSRQVDAVIAAGVSPEQVIVDPGIGFAKRAEHNWPLLARLAEIGCLDAPGSPFRVLVGASRKSFLGALLAGPDGRPRPSGERDDASTAVACLAAYAGAWCVRAHAAAGSADAVRVAARWRQAAAAEGGRP